MKTSLPNFASLSDTAVASIAAHHERPDFRKAAQEFLDTPTATPKKKRKKVKAPAVTTPAPTPVQTTIAPPATPEEIAQAAEDQRLIDEAITKATEDE